MSTRSHIGYRNDDNTISAVYCHFDGYPDNMIPALAEYIETKGIEAFKARVADGQEGAGFRSFCPSGGETYFEHRGETDSWVETNRANLTHDYAYIYSGKNGLLVEFYSYGSPHHKVALGEEDSLDAQVEVENFLKSLLGQ